MKNTYRIEIGIRKRGGRILLKEKVEVDECIMKDLLDVITERKPLAIAKIITKLDLDLAQNSSIESIEIRED